MRWPMTRLVERQATRMQEMMDQLNVDGAALARIRQGAVYMEARTRCLACEHSERCLKWLDSKPAADIQPDFCPNLDLFKQCQRHDRTKP